MFIIISYFLMDGAAQSTGFNDALWILKQTASSWTLPGYVPHCFQTHL